MTNVVRPCIRYGEALLDQRLGLRVEAGGGLVQDQDARIGEDRARDRDALALAARQLHAALADDRVVPFSKRFGELVHARDAAGLQHLLLGRVGPREGDVLADRAVEQERLLQHHAELRAVGVEAHGREVDAVDEHATPGLGAWNAATRPMIVDLPEPDGPTSAVTVPGSARKRHAVQHGLAGLVREVARPRTPRPRDARRASTVRRGSASSGRSRSTSRVRSRPAERLGDLRADADHLEHGRDQEAEEEPCR